MSNYSQAEPSANITINGKNRVKQSEDGKVYLDDNQEFGIELFNPTQDVLLAKIKMNGKFISHAGLIMNPGERTFLDRYIDTTDKFKFSVYKVEAGNSEVEHAIAENGVVEIYWYKERENVEINYPVWISTTTFNKSYPITCNDYVLTSSGTASKLINENRASSLSAAINATVKAVEPSVSACCCDCISGSSSLTSSLSSTASAPGSSFASASYNSTGNNSWQFSASECSTTLDGTTITTSEVEEYKDGECINHDKKTYYDTGRIAKGGKSEQELIRDNDHVFYSYSSYVNKIHIMPISTKPVTQKDLDNRKLYCPNCGKKLHKKYKFCPNCGHKI